MAIEAISSISTSNQADRIARILAEAALRLQKSVSRTSSGVQNVEPDIDPAGLAQFIRFDAQVSRISAADSNVTNAVSFSQTQNGMLGQAQATLNRMGELRVLAQDQTKSADDRAIYQHEFAQLQDHLGTISTETFNGVNLFSSTDVAVAGDSDGSSFVLSGIDVAASGSSGGLSDTFSGISISTPSSAASALDAINVATENLASLRASVGSNLQRLNVTSETNSVLSENLSAAKSRLNDLDFAQESTQRNGYELLIKAGTASLARANAAARSTISLLA
jgi:flagellin